MPPERQSRRTKYNYSEETLARLVSCSNCGKQFKTQGIKSHETSCKARSKAEKDRVEAGRRYEKVLKKALRGEYMLHGFLTLVHV